MATSGDFSGHQRLPQLATSGDFLTATDTWHRRRAVLDPIPPESQPIFFRRAIRSGPAPVSGCMIKTLRHFRVGKFMAGAGLTLAIAVGAAACGSSSTSTKTNAPAGSTNAPAQSPPTTAASGGGPSF